uniref:3-keto-alpha-glucoside-1,2-lyase/3-keto-2-hydroxy-glucal hydratase domain-containing protein n=1 Tax=Solibacter usitatus (strain Ellin6076) TaxID=234267 RepID=Q022Y3_SOLUE
MRYVTFIVGLCCMGAIVFCAPQDTGKKGGKGGAKKVEVAHPFYWAPADPLRGDWQGEGYVAQVVRADDRLLSIQDQLPSQEDANKYVANIFHKFDVVSDKPTAILHGDASGGTVEFTGDGWTGAITAGHFKASKAEESFDLQHVTRTPPSLGAKPPAKAVVLFDGSNMNLWAKMKEKDWLTEDGPSLWHLVPTAAMEVVPRTGSLISRKAFGDAKLHVEFRTLGGPTNSGVYIQDRYEANINEVYGRLDGNPCAGFDNCTPADARPKIRCSRPPLEWQTLDIDFHAPRFDAAGKKTANPRVTMLFNGTEIYNDRELGPVTLNAARLGEAPTGPIQLQEHGMPVQFRNIWILEQ